MNTVESIVEAVNAAAARAGQGLALVYSESTTPIPGVDAVKFTCSFTVPSGKVYETTKKFMEPAGVFIALAKEGALAAVIYDLLNS